MQYHNHHGKWIHNVKINSNSTYHSKWNLNVQWSLKISFLLVTCSDSQARVFVKGNNFLSCNHRRIFIKTLAFFSSYKLINCIKFPHFHFLWTTYNLPVFPFMTLFSILIAFSSTYFYFNFDLWIRKEFTKFCTGGNNAPLNYFGISLKINFCLIKLYLMITDNYWC